MPRTPPSFNRAAYAEEHLFYEVQMFVGARGALSHLPFGTFEKNAMIEVCVLHLRNLVDFFYNPEPKPDDVVASDYVADWDSKRPPSTAVLDKARQRANKEMAHLTTKRIAGATPEKEWDFVAAGSDLKSAVALFINHATPTDLPTNAVSALQMI